MGIAQGKDQASDYDSALTTFYIGFNFDHGTYLASSKHFNYQLPKQPAIACAVQV